MEMVAKQGRLGANALKFIAIIAMLIDHIAWAFVPFASPLGQIMHIIGRITAPTMCFFIAEGYFHTRDVKKYALRLGIFAVLSHCPFILFEFGKPFVNQFYTSVIYSLFMGLMALWAWDRISNPFLKIGAILLCCILAMPGDWACFAVIYVLIFGANRGNFKKQAIAFSIASFSMVLLATAMSGNPYSQLFQLGVFLSLPLIALYNGQKGKGGKFAKWAFYIFYPLHLLIIGLIEIYLGGF